MPREYLNENVRDFGRMRNFRQGVSLSYTLPFKYLPGLDWITAKAQYDGDYNWTAGSQLLNNVILANSTDELDMQVVGNTIQNSQRRAFNTTLAFDKLYDKIPYLKSISKKPRRTARTSRRGAPRPANNDRAADRRRNTREASTFEKIFIRPLLSLREVKLSYSEDLTTVVPGFLETPKYLGVGAAQQPGYAFAFGIQPDLQSFLFDLGTNGHISTNPFLNQQVNQSTITTFDGKIELEPWADLTINVDFKKSFTNNDALDYVFGPDLNNTLPVNQIDQDAYEFAVRGFRSFGSYETSFWTLQTLFGYDIQSLFRQFEKNRIAVSERLLNIHNSTNPNDPRANLPHDNDGPLFTQGYGRQNQDVLIPAFIAAYTNQNPDEVNLDLTEQISKNSYIPKPNWELRYNGLNKLPWFKDIFSSVSISHGYNGQLEVNSFQTDLQYDKYYEPDFPLTNVPNQNNFDIGFIDPLISTRNYFSRYEIPDIVISERFAPVFGIDIKTVNDMNINFEFAKARTLSLDLGVGQLNEVNTTEVLFGFGWVLQDVNIPFLTGRKIKIPKIRASADTKDGVKIGDDDKEEERENTRGGERGVNVEQNKMNITFNFGLRDDVTFLHELDSGASSKATRGLKSISIAPAVDYDINKNFTLRAFVDYQLTEPYVSDSFRSTRINGGITARFNLN